MVALREEFETSSMKTQNDDLSSELQEIMTSFTAGRMALRRFQSRGSPLAQLRITCRRSFLSNPCSTDHTHLVENASVHRIGDDRYGSREYVLLPEGISSDMISKDPKLKLASVYAHKNIVFGAKVANPNLGLAKDVCGSLLGAALQDASQMGEQPQAIATLHGLCEWVLLGFENSQNISALRSLGEQENEAVTYEAVKAIATGIPRPGHSVVGVGTYRDGRVGWEALAREFVDKGLGEEAVLYQTNNGELVAIEHLADQSEPYLKSAGGAMARFFFL